MLWTQWTENIPEKKLSVYEHFLDIKKSINIHIHTHAHTQTHREKKIKH